MVEPSSHAALRLAALRAKGLAVELMTHMERSDVPPLHWEEVLSWLSYLVEQKREHQAKPEAKDEDA